MMGIQHKVVGIGFGIATAIYMAEGLGEPGPAIIALGASTIGCMLPDIDHDNSKIGRKRKVVTDITSRLTSIVAIGAILALAGILAGTAVGMVHSNTDPTMLITGLLGLIGFVLFASKAKNSKTFQWMTHHRGFMHTLIPPALIALLIFASDMKYWRAGTIGLCIGYLSHLLADMLTIEGCPVLWPLTKKNIRFLKLKTKNASTWIAAVLLAALPCVIVFLKFGEK